MRIAFIVLISLACPLLVFGQGYNVNGDAEAIGDNCYILTPALNDQIGSIWYNEQVSLNEPFDIQFTANFDDSDAGADGIVFVFQQVSNTVVGNDGEGMGFQGFQPSLGIEFDIYQNGNQGDPTFDHIAIVSEGSVNHNSPTNLAGPVQASSSDANIEDGQDHIIQISWDPGTQIFSCWFDCELRVEANIDVVNDVFDGDPTVYWGFTGATGGQVAEMVLCLDPFILGLPESYTACPGDEVQITFSDSEFGTYSWEPAEFLDDPTIPNPTATVFDTTTFVLTYTDLCGDTQIDSTRIDIEFLDINLGQDFNLCPGNTQEILLPEAYEYVWSNGFEGNPIIIDQAGTYFVDATFGNCFGSDTLVVGEANDVISLSFEVSPTICGDSNGSLVITEVIGSGGPYTFDIGGAPQTDSTFAGLNSGTYTLTATSPDGCIFTENFTIESILLVEAGFIADPTMGLAPLQVNLTDISTNASNFYYLVDGVVVPYTESIVFDEAGTYILSQLAWNNDFFCNDTFSVEIIVEPLIDLLIPNILTPNSDGRNDVFTVQMEGIISISIEVYNRWGNLVHSTERNAEDLEFLDLWNPEDVSEGVYFFLIEAIGADGVSIKEQGTVQVMTE
jgi:gliding motility-associated-like protein